LVIFRAELVCPYKHYINWTALYPSLRISNQGHKEESIMNNVLTFPPVKRIDLTDSCAGCGGIIIDEYTEIVLTGDKDKTHIALCPKCSKSAERQSVI